MIEFRQFPRASSCSQPRRAQSGLAPAVFLLCGFLAGTANGQTHSQISGDQTRILTNIQTGSSYTIQASDCGKLISFANSNAVAVILPQAGTVMLSGCWIELQNIGAGTVTITSNVSTIDGSGSIQLATGAGMQLISSFGQYYSQRGQSGGAGSGSVNVSAAAHLAYYPSLGPAVSGSGCIIGGSSNGDLTCSSFTSNGLSQGEVDFYPAANSPTYIGVAAPTSVPATYTMQWPGGAPANQVLSFGPPLNGTAYGSWVNAIVLAGIGPVASIPFAASFSGQYYLATDSSDCSIGGGAANTLCRSTGSAWIPLNGGSAGSGGGSGGGNNVSGGSNLTSAGAVPFENGTAGTVTQDAGFVYDSAGHHLSAGTTADSVTIGTLWAGYSGLWAKTAPGGNNYMILSDGTNSFFNARIRGDLLPPEQSGRHENLAGRHNPANSRTGFAERDTLCLRRYVGESRFTGHAMFRHITMKLIKSILIALSAVSLCAGAQSVVLNNGAHAAGTFPSKAALASIGGFRYEFRLHNIAQPVDNYDWLFTVGNIYVNGFAVRFIQATQVLDFGDRPDNFVNCNWI